MEFNLNALLVGQSARLRYVPRFSTCQRLHSENVAEHSYYVAFYSMVIVDWVNANSAEAGIPVEIDLGTVLSYALLHDLEECITGDLPRAFKYSLPEVATVLHDAGELAMHRIMSEVVPDFADEYVQEWTAAKDEATIDGCIVRFADYLAVLSYMVCELTNNRTMTDNWNTMHDYQITFQKKEYDFIRPLVDEAGTILANAFRRMN